MKDKINYDELSDFEINKLVAESLGLDAIGQSERENNSSIWLYDLQAYVDYCNNPNDAWPIIVENKMTIVPTTVGLKEWTAWHPNKGLAATTQDDNPLRAAMIVFLMMKESDND